MYFMKVSKDAMIPSDLDISAADLIGKLLRRNPEERIGSRKGVKEIKSHPFLKDINWSKMLNKEIEPVYKPDPRSTNFEFISLG